MPDPGDALEVQRPPDREVGEGEARVQLLEIGRHVRRAEVESYHAAKLALQNELRSELDRLRPLDPAARAEGLAALSRRQTPRIVELEKTAEQLSSGTWTHDYPITVDEARNLGLPIKTDVPDEVYRLMCLYPQTGQRRPSVEYIPTPREPRPAHNGAGR